MNIVKKGTRFGKCKNQTNLLRKYEKLVKPFILERDNKKCQVAGYRHDCSLILVVDHRPSKRGNHSTFLDVRNLTTVCSNANWQAERDPFLSLAIVNVVIGREGDIIEELNILSKTPKKWSEQECREWLQKIEKHFITNKNGTPNSKSI